MTQTTVWGVFYDHVVALPLHVAEADIATLIFDVPVERVRRHIPDDSFLPVLAPNGAAQLIMSFNDYRRTDWRTCQEIMIGFLVHPVAAPDQFGILTHRLAVNDALTCEVSRGVMNYPVSIELIETGHTADQAVFSLAVGVHPTLELRLPRHAPGPPASGRLVLNVYSHRDGTVLVMPFELDKPTTVPVDHPQLQITLGHGPYADELRRLLPESGPRSCTWGENLTATFHAPSPLTGS